MLAILGFICGIIAAFLKFDTGHQSAMLWFIIIGLLLVAAEMVWGWHRGGYYGNWRRGTPPG
jgi:hypothetical protein